MTEQKKNKKSKALLLFLLIFISIYLIVTVVFSFIALPNTSINGRDISFASKDEALKKPIESFTIDIKGRDSKEMKLNLDKIDYKAYIPESAAIDQNPFLWPVAFLNLYKQDFTFDYNIEYDQKKLKDEIEASALMNKITQPEDASVKYQDGKFVITPEVIGNKLDNKKFIEKIKDAIYTQKEDIVLEDKDYINPKVKNNSKELANLLADAKTIENIKIGFNFNGFDFKLEGKELIDMFDPDGEKFKLNDDRLIEYVKSLADKTDTYGTNRTFNATGIGKITVAPGVYGFILDVKATADKVSDLVAKRISGDVEPVYERMGLSRNTDGGDIGNTYAEVDLSRQYMWFYLDGNLMFETPIVSGKPVSRKWATNVGVGSILSKERNQTLKGSNFDGVSKYETDVKYWMPIGWDGEGFHDAPWRGGAFGGGIYFSNGSHGCINMPPALAGKLFELAPHNTPVIVYESNTNYSPTMSY